MTLDVQFITMIAMMIGGFYLGVASDTFRRLCVYWKQRVVLKYFMEIGFWLTQTLLLYYVLFQVNSGELRFYVFVALLLGFAMYQALAANMYKRLLEYLIGIIVQIYRFLVKVTRVIIIIPVTFLIQLIITIIVGTATILLKLIRFTFKIVLAPVIWLFRMVFRMLPQSIQKRLHKIAGFYSIIENTCKKWIQKSKRR
ncbi:spore cortex biosynthesis protein YabQ [Lentibacillus salicampi]|uniref:Spore cortex biosynthesis protein YabQ n=1 Tax=Lentibacillus salicampi TaxID=175306 RepID=A0A4Y9AF23_9BACI|nr:spore cortex biosynthesis protein YabQ [Lentibacillus salicampi]TFJ92991.1 spore cortex biosynthesis protein YabQ [Lentibacillus salicampi]